MSIQAMEPNGQLTFDDDPISIKFKEGFQLIMEGNFKEAVDCFETVMEKAPYYLGVEDSIRTSKFWLNRAKRIAKLPKGEERANFLLDEWAEFEEFISKSKIKYDYAVTVLKKYIHGIIARNLTINFQQAEIPNIETLVKLGEVFIATGEYEKAVETLEYARIFRRNDALILSLLAEGYNSLNDSTRAKVLFREAFSIDPQMINLDKLKTPFIVMLREHVKAAGFVGNEVAEWMPVFGVLENILNIKKELTKEEFAKLESETGEMEHEYNSTNFSKKTLEPRLLNKYFRIIDYCLIEGLNTEKIKMIDSKVKELNPEVYKKYNNMITGAEGK